MARSARHDVRLRAAVFVEPDETSVSGRSSPISRVSSASPADRRREHRERGSRVRSRLLRRRSGTKTRVPSLLLSTAARDPYLIASLAALAVSNSSLRSLRCSLESCLLRRRSGTKTRVPSLLLSTAARDRYLIASLANPRGSPACSSRRSPNHGTL